MAFLEGMGEKGLPHGNFSKPLAVDAMHPKSLSTPLAGTRAVPPKEEEEEVAAPLSSQRSPLALFSPHSRAAPTILGLFWVSTALYSLY